MKTVRAEIVSSSPVTVSKAASVLSKFVSAETGASQAVNAYLRRATAALAELDRKKHKSVAQVEHKSSSEKRKNREEADEQKKKKKKRRKGGEDDN